MKLRAMSKEKKQVARVDRDPLPHKGFAADELKILCGIGCCRINCTLFFRNYHTCGDLGEAVYE